MKIRIACIGCGYFSDFHLEAWNRIEGASVVALCDPDKEKAAEKGEKYQVPDHFTSVEELCDQMDFDVADIISPPETHHAICRILVKFGVDIICQKPLAPTYEDCMQLADLIANSKSRFMVHENFRFQPWYREAKRQIDLGAIGEQIFSARILLRTGDGWGEDAYLDRQPYFRDMERLFMHETGVHYVDVFKYLFGDVRSVYAQLRRLNPVIKGEDSALVLLDLEQGVTAIIDANRYNESAGGDPRYTFGQLTVEGSGGTLSVSQDGTMDLMALGQEKKQIEYSHRDHGFAGDCVYFTQKHFLESYLNNDPFEVELENYLETLRVVENVYLSASRRKVIDI